MAPYDPWLTRHLEPPEREQHHRTHLRELRPRRAANNRYRQMRMTIGAALHILADRIAP